MTNAAFFLALFANLYRGGVSEQFDACTSDTLSLLQQSSHASKKIERTGVVTDSEASGQIPKIVHHIYKTDISHGPWPNSIWKESYSAWKRFFPEPEYQHSFWSDSEVAAFVDSECSKFSKSYDQEKREIVKSDFSRYCILWRLGGIYADLDYMPVRNFYADLQPGMVNLIQSPYSSETVQNSLMASPPNSSYWAEIMDIAHYTMRASNVLLAAGPRLLDVSPKTRDLSAVHILPCNEFQRVTKSVEEHAAITKGCKMLNPDDLHDESLKGIHWGTVSYDASGKSVDSEVPDRWLKLFGTEQKVTEQKVPQPDADTRNILLEFVNALKA